MRHAILMLMAVLVMSGVHPARAHELRPGYLEVRQTGPETFAMLWKVPARDGLRLSLYPQLPDNCTPASEPLRFQTADAYTERATMTCAGGLAGRRIAIDGLTATLTDVLVRLLWTNGAGQSVRLAPSAPSFAVAAVPSSTAAPPRTPRQGSCTWRRNQASARRRCRRIRAPSSATARSTTAAASSARCRRLRDTRNLKAPSAASSGVPRPR